MFLKHTRPFIRTSTVHSRFFSTTIDYYTLLNATKSDSQATLKKKYRALAKKYHPDANSSTSDPEKFQEITEAYETLKDEKSRQAYDSMSHDQYTQFKKSGVDPNQTFHQSNPFSFNDIFSDFFGGSQRPTRTYQRPNISENIQLSVTLSFWEAALGASKTLAYRVNKVCTSCDGVGTENGERAELEECAKCNGSGTQARRINQGMQYIEFQEPCGACNGRGRTLKNECSSCAGQGLNGIETKQEEVNIPPGVSTGQIYRVRGAGQAGGDLQVVIQAERGTVDQTKEGHKIRLWVESDGNLWIEREIDLARALLGGEVDVIDGSRKEIDVKLTPGVKEGDVMRLRGRGIRRRDAYLKLSVQVPEELTERQREIIEEFGRIEESKTRDSKKRESGT
eukprot:augustus_masked-scaffold_7-processed-gene-5.8-mRNA-1 protein AED:0.35 eAED:0.35 QI:0/-1/0/1/-1/1/1/0/394